MAFNYIFLGLLVLAILVVGSGAYKKFLSKLPAFHSDEKRPRKKKIIKIIVSLSIIPMVLYIFEIWFPGIMKEWFIGESPDVWVAKGAILVAILAYSVERYVVTVIASVLTFILFIMTLVDVNETNKSRYYRYYDIPQASVETDEPQNTESAQKNLPIQAREIQTQPATVANDPPVVDKPAAEEITADLADEDTARVVIINTAVDSVSADIPWEQTYTSPSVTTHKTTYDQQKQRKRMTWSDMEKPWMKQGQGEATIKDGGYNTYTPQSTVRGPVKTTRSSRVVTTKRK